MLRLWLPQIFQAIDDYRHLHNGTTGSLCSMLELLHPEEKNGEIEECIVVRLTIFIMRYCPV